MRARINRKESEKVKMDKIEIPGNRLNPQNQIFKMSIGKIYTATHQPTNQWFREVSHQALNKLAYSLYEFLVLV